MQREFTQMLGKTFIHKVSFFSLPMIKGMRYPDAAHRPDSRRLGASPVPGQKHSPIPGGVEQSSHPQWQKRENLTHVSTAGTISPTATQPGLWRVA